MKNLNKLKQLIKIKGINARIHNFASAYEGVGAKYTEGLSTLLFCTDKGDYIAILKRDDRKVDNQKLKSFLGVKNIKLCSLEQLKEIGFEPNSVSPLLLGDIKIVIDKSVKEMKTAYCGTGSTKHTLEIKSDDLLNVLKDYEVYDFTVADPNKGSSLDISVVKNIEGTKKIEEISLEQVKPTNNNFRDLVNTIKKAGIKDVNFIKHRPMYDVDEYIAELGLDYNEGVSTLVFKTERGFIGIYRRDDKKIDTKKVKKLLKIKNLQMATEKEVREEFSFDVGAIGVFNKNLKYCMDKSLLEKDYVYGGAGDERYDIKIKPNDLRNLTNAKVLEITEESHRAKKRILTGDTPSGIGRLHLGHYVGTLENRVKLQEKYDTYILIANIHAYANYYDKSKEINEAGYQTFLDNLAVGINPNIATIFLESGIPELYELYGFFLTIVKKNRVMRNPSVKEEIEYKKLDPSIAFICYPILQAADILGFNADLVPVGEDQSPILEQVREIARDFNKTYGDTFVVPKAKIGRVARLIGTDGKKKMSKSGANSIFLSDDEETLKKKVMSVYTDPDRIHATDPGKVEGNPVFVYHDTFNPDKDEVEELKDRYKSGKVGDVEVKEKLFSVLNNFLGPIRKKRKYYEDRPDEAKGILIEGTKRARKVVQEVVERFRENIGINELIKK